MKNLKFVVVALVAVLVGMYGFAQTANASYNPTDAALSTIAAEGAGGQCSDGSDPVPTTWDFAAGLEPWTATFFDHSGIGVVNYTWVTTNSNAPGSTGNSTSGAPYAYSVDFDGEENGTGNLYDQYMTSPAFEVPSGAPAIMTYQNLQAWEVSDTECWDSGRVEVSTDGGSTWEYITPTSNPFSVTPAYDMKIHFEYDGLYPYTDAMSYCPQTLDPGGNGWGWRDWAENTVDLSNYAGETIQVRFTTFTDNLLGAHGWLVDDIEMDICVDTPTAVTVSDFDSSTSIPVLPMVGMALVGLIAVGVVARRIRR